MLPRILLATVLILGQPVSAEDRLVPGQYPTIQAAINAASSGDRILVSPGSYGDSISFNGKDVDLESTGGASLTTIDLSTMSEFEMGPNGSVIGFTIRGGRGEIGGGIEVSRDGSYIADNIFEDNWLQGSGRGAAIAILSGSPIIERNIFRRGVDQGRTSTRNVSMIFAISSEAPQIINNLFHDNDLPCINSVLTRPFPGMLVVNNTMVRNAMGIRIETRPGEAGHIFRNNLIIGGQFGVENFYFGPGESPPLGIWENNLIHGSTAPYYGMPDPTGTNGNLSADPLFTNSAGNDFTLQPGSPAIDAGTNMSAPLLDLNGTSRPVDGDGDTVAVSDIGAFEAGISEGIGLFIEGELDRECDTIGGALFNISTRTEPDDLSLQTLSISIDGKEVATTSPAQIMVPVGTHLIAVHALTADGNVVEDSEFVNVTDTTPPTLKVWFESKRSGQPIDTIQYRLLSQLIVRVEAVDICDPNPQVSSVLGTPVTNGQPLNYQGSTHSLSLRSRTMTLSATATDKNGNTSQTTKELEVEIPRLEWPNASDISTPRRGSLFRR
ncbi:MAG: choice-of-anchor Q domain-containing protein [Haloferula sp.]